jgi:hypothetical protein
LNEKGAPLNCDCRAMSRLKNFDSGAGFAGEEVAQAAAQVCRAAQSIG